jgi:sulfur-carrier protein
VISILFFAQLREQLHCEKLELDFVEFHSLMALRERIIQLNPHWEDYLRSDKLLYAVNQALVKSSYIVKDGDEVAFFPPVTGG